MMHMSGASFNNLLVVSGRGSAPQNLGYYLRWPVCEVYSAQITPPHKAPLGYIIL